jgi:putative DNA primase/helicase
VFAGTANSSNWLDDATGGRRFIPIDCQEINLEYLRESRDQLFAEAVHIFRKVPRGTSAPDRAQSGADWWQMPLEETLAEQAARQGDEPWLEKVRVWLKRRETVDIPEVLSLCLEIDVEKHDQNNSRRVGKILKRVGYQNKVVRDGKDVSRRWVLVDKQEGQQLSMAAIDHAGIDEEIPF